MFANFQITNLRETALAADRWLDETSRLEWKSSNYQEEEIVNFQKVSNLSVTLKPMEVRTFVATIERENSNV